MFSEYQASGIDRHGRRCDAIGEVPEIALAQCQATAAELDGGDNPVPTRLDFTSAVQFESFLADLQDMLEAGTLLAVHRCDGIDGRAVAAIQPGTVWPDVIDAEFRDRADRRHRLSVDIFHGQGGRWCRSAADLEVDGRAKVLPS